jgi:uncharacterized membrane protein
MTWALVALFGYFFNAISAVFDKYLLSDRIPTPAVYAFFVSLFSLFALGFVPFGFQFEDMRTTGILLISGMLFVYGLVAFYQAVKQHEVSRVAPLVGTIVSLVAFLAVFSPGVSGETHMSVWYIVALILLIVGGLLISFDLPLRRGEHISRYVFIAGVLMGLSFLFLKEGYAYANFQTGLVWSRLGMTLAGFTLLLVPQFRQQIFAQFQGFSHRSSRATSTGFLFILNKVTAGIASLLIAYAISLGSVSFVQALSGMQYVFILALMIPLSFRFPGIFGEKLYFWDWFQKAVAIIIIGWGLWLATVSGVPLLFG